MASLAKPTLYAVLTGDVVDSSGLRREERRGLPALLHGAAKELKRSFPKAVAHDLEIFRGDSWQLVVSDPALSLRVALAFRAALLAGSPGSSRLDTRIAIAIDRIDFLPADNVSAGDGPAYRASGEALDQLEPGVRLALRCAGDPAWRDVTLRLVDAIAQEWTPKQARAVAGRLRGWTQAEIAEHWPERITQQSVARHLARSHWAAIEPAIRQLEANLPLP